MSGEEEIVVIAENRECEIPQTVQERLKEEICSITSCLPAIQNKLLVKSISKFKRIMKKKSIFFFFVTGIVSDFEKLMVTSQSECSI